MPSDHDGGVLPCGGVQGVVVQHQRFSGWAVECRIQNIHGALDRGHPERDLGQSDAQKGRKTPRPPEVHIGDWRQFGVDRDDRGGARSVQGR